MDLGPKTGSSGANLQVFCFAFTIPFQNFYTVSVFQKR